MALSNDQSNLCESSPLLDVHYSYESAGPVRRLVRWTAGIGPVSWLLARSLDRIDRAVFQVSKGRHTCASLISGLPVVMLTTTGARTGRPSTVPVVGIPDGEKLAVIASNYGQRRHPAWYHNLVANPAAEVSVHGVQKRMRARLAHGQERDHIWARGIAIYPAWNVYQRRASQREIAIFVLEKV
jgi:deazaflavin-dependent oxidoreductase (nitroreductase family)